MVERPNTTVAAPKTMTARKRVRPIRRSSGIAGQEDDVTSAPTAGAERRSPSPRGPGAQDVAGVDGQERGGAAQQHREQVERHRAEQHGPAPDEGDAREHGGSVTGSRARGLCAGSGSPRRRRPASTNSAPAVA